MESNAPSAPRGSVVGNPEIGLSQKRLPLGQRPRLLAVPCELSNFSGGRWAAQRGWNQWTAAAAPSPYELGNSSPNRKLQPIWHTALACPLLSEDEVP